MHKISNKKIYQLHKTKWITNLPMFSSTRSTKYLEMQRIKTKNIYSENIMNWK